MPYLGDLIEIDSTLLTSNVIGLIGPSASGKSCMAEEIVRKIQNERPHGKTDVCYLKTPSFGIASLCEHRQFSKNVNFLFDSYKNDDDDDPKHLILVIDNCHLMHIPEYLPLKRWLPNKQVHLVLMSQTNNVFMNQLATGPASFTSIFALYSNRSLNITVDGLKENFAIEESDQEEQEEGSKEDEGSMRGDEDDNLAETDLKLAIDILFSYGEAKAKERLTSTPEPLARLGPELQELKELSHTDRKRLKRQNEGRMPSFFRPVVARSITTQEGSEFVGVPSHSATSVSERTDDLHQWMELVNLDGNLSSEKLDSVGGVKRPSEISAAWWM